MNQTKKIWNKVVEMNMSNNFLLGPVNAESILHDPKHLLFTLARYKFATKMLVNARHIVEIGCGEGIGALMFLAETKADITAIDFDQQQIAYAKNNVLSHGKGRLIFDCHDFVETSYHTVKADGFVCLDVIEHIYSKEEKDFLSHTTGMIEKGGIAVWGTPNKDAQKYMSARSKVGHINLFDADRFQKTLDGYFSQTFLFSMNDEVVHTGFNRMAHYLIAVCIK